MLTLLILLAFGIAFAAFALLGAAERERACLHERIGDPKCERCPLGGGEDGVIAVGRSEGDNP